MFHFPLQAEKIWRIPRTLATRTCYTHVIDSLSISRIRRILKCYLMTLWIAGIGNRLNVYGALVILYCQRKAEVLGDNSVPVPVSLPQIAHGLVWDWTRASKLRDPRTNLLGHGTALPPCRSYYLIKLKISMLTKPQMAENTCRTGNMSISLQFEKKNKHTYDYFDPILP